MRFITLLAFMLPLSVLALPQSLNNDDPKQELSVSLKGAGNVLVYIRGLVDQAHLPDAAGQAKDILSDLQLAIEAAERMRTEDPVDKTDKDIVETKLAFVKFNIEHFTGSIQDHHLITDDELEKKFSLASIYVNKLLQDAQGYIDSISTGNS